MKEITSIVLVLVAIYLLIAALLFVFQRKLIYYPVSIDSEFRAEEITFENDGERLHGWVLNPGKEQALIYFGGNSELITSRRGFFDALFSDYSVYLVNYRGYGNSQGDPTEAALLSDALAIYDHIAPRHRTISAYGRSLGSGVAVYLAAKRPLERLILLTPYDSIAEVAQSIYPLFPVRYLIRERFDSVAMADQVKIPVLIAAAELDRVIGLQHTLALRDRLTRAQVEFVMIEGAAHNDITEFPKYRDAIQRFVAVI